MEPANKTNKLDELRSMLTRYNSAVIAFSGGVDSTLLARVARDSINGNLLLVTATSSTYPFYELDDAKKIAAFLKIKHRIIVSEEIEIPGFSNNPPDRCYYCKSELFAKIRYIAEQENYDVVFDGSNADDLNDFRPGIKALKEKGILSPLVEAGLNKEEIRELSRKFNLPTAEKPAYACLASRFPYGEKITRKKLDRVALAEKEIRNLGFKTFRVRSHENLARLEFDRDEMDRAWGARNKLRSVCEKAGFLFITMDLKDFKSGSMNIVLKNQNSPYTRPKK
ncbi:MAG: hypothetical protein AMS26_05915 [Bacteroides sp. SM23_62]|nr:MAG: hypothetical protein AMS26_05915 [Bacteroides sp. SM23_62]